jgi:hypothetical protein
MENIEYDGMIKRIGCKLDNRVYTNWKGQNIIKTYTKQKNVKYSGNQLLMQKAFREVGAIWNSIPLKLKLSWKGCADGQLLTDYSIFVRSNLKSVTDGKPGKLALPAGMEKITGMTASSSAPGSVTFSYPVTTEAPSLSAFVRKISDTEGEPVTAKINLTATTSTATLDGLESGAEYFVYVIRTDKAFAESGMMSESEGFRVKVN